MIVLNNVNTIYSKAESIKNNYDLIRILVRISDLYILLTRSSETSFIEQFTLPTTTLS